MVSDDTLDRTQEMLEQGGWFGMEEDQITLMKQEKVAALQVCFKFTCQTRVPSPLSKMWKVS